MFCKERHASDCGGRGCGVEIIHAVGYPFVPVEVVVIVASRVCKIAGFPYAGGEVDGRIVSLAVFLFCHHYFPEFCRGRLQVDVEKICGRKTERHFSRGISLACCRYRFCVFGREHTEDASAVGHGGDTRRAQRYRCVGYALKSDVIADYA